MTIRPAQPLVTQTLEHVLAADPAVIRGYARAAADRMASGVLTLADRDLLLRRGERLGLGRFDANLILAVVERRQRATLSPTRPALRAVRSGDRPPRRIAWPTAAAAVALQASIVAAAWWLVV